MILVGIPIIPFLPLQFLIILYASCSPAALYYLLISLYMAFMVFFFMQHPTVTSRSPIAQIRGDCFQDGS